MGVGRNELICRRTFIFSANPVPFVIKGVSPDQARGTTQITGTPRKSLPPYGIAIKPEIFGVSSNRRTKRVLAGIRLHVNWQTSSSGTSYAPTIPRGLGHLGLYSPYDKSVESGQPGNLIELYAYTSYDDAFVGTRTALVTAEIPVNNVGVTCPK